MAFLFLQHYTDPLLTFGDSISPWMEQAGDQVKKRSVALSHYGNPNPFVLNAGSKGYLSHCISPCGLPWLLCRRKRTGRSKFCHIRFAPEK